MTDPDTTKPGDPAVARFAVLQLIRLSGAALVLIGVLILSGKFTPLAFVPPVAGYAIAAIGMVEFFWVPLLLARAWRSK
ncbi:hypothetical protein [Novosphingobium lentum]|uniref:hypothetical protein n=1 Tax=Novosphingobium lentum TaxID=145287 RepID=UPI00082FDB1D|nr:hypothetical protein [Novosphingobium lentum]